MTSRHFWQMRHFPHARTGSLCVVLLSVACFKIPSADGTGVQSGVLNMLNSGESTGIESDISRIEDLAREGEYLLEQWDYEGAFIAWLGVHRLAERTFGTDDQVSVDALRLAITSLELIERINHADQLLNKAFAPDAPDTETTLWCFRDHLPQLGLPRLSEDRPIGRVRARRVRRGPASSAFIPHTGRCDRRIPHGRG